MKPPGNLSSYGLEMFRVWPDGTTQPVEDGPPLSHLSDDFLLIPAWNPDHALHVAREVERLPSFREELRRLEASIDPALPYTDSYSLWSAGTGLRDEQRLYLRGKIEYLESLIRSAKPAA